MDYPDPAVRVGACHRGLTLNIVATQLASADP